MTKKHAWAAYKKSGGVGGGARPPPPFANTIVFKWDLFDLAANSTLARFLKKRGLGRGARQGIRITSKHACTALKKAGGVRRSTMLAPTFANATLT